MSTDDEDQQVMLPGPPAHPGWWEVRAATWRQPFSGGSGRTSVLVGDPRPSRRLASLLSSPAHQHKLHQPHLPWGHWSVRCCKWTRAAEWAAGVWPEFIQPFSQPLSTFPKPALWWAETLLGTASTAMAVTKCNMCRTTCSKMKNLSP